MNNLDFFTRKTVTVVQTAAEFRDIPMWTYSDFGISEKDSYWFITHLPSGLSFGMALLSIEQAANAVVELSMLKNTWANVTTKEMEQLNPIVADIIARHRRVPRNPNSDHSQPTEFKNYFNGYNRD